MEHQKARVLDIAFLSQGATLRGYLILTQERHPKTSGCCYGSWLYNNNNRNDSR